MLGVAEEVLLQAVVYITGALAVAAGVPYLKVLRENRELFKARLFLDYDRYVRMWRWTALGLAGAILVGLAYTFTREGSIFVELFVPYGILTLLFNAGILYISTTIYRIIREAG